MMFLFKLVRKLLGVEGVEIQLAKLEKKSEDQGDALRDLSVTMQNQNYILGHVDRELTKAKEQTAELVKTVAFIRHWMEANQHGLKLIQQIRMIQENQSLKLKRLERRIEGEFIPQLESLLNTAPDADARKDIVNFRARVRNNLTRAAKKVG